MSVDTKFGGVRGAVLRGTVAVVACSMAAACTVGGETSSEPAKQASGEATLTVWTDSIRKPLFEAYQEAHPEVSLKIETNDGSPEELASKILLANKAGQGWPDVLATSSAAAGSLATDPYSLSLDLTPLVDEDIVGDFTDGTLDPCTVGEELICLRGDFAPGVLWYNPKLMEQFGYSVPTTWEDFRDLGLKLAEEHPGYIVGSASDSWDDLTYYASSKCPAPEFVGDNGAKVDLNDPNCTRVTELLDDLLDADVLARNAVVDPKFAQEYGAPEKILMLVGPIWYGSNVFRNMFKTKSGSLSFAAPLRWEEESEPTTGDIGGKGYVVSRHSEYQEAAADLVTWATTGPFLATKESVTLPAYQPQQEAWLRNTIDAGTFVAVDTPLEDVLAEAGNNIWTGMTYKQANFQTYGQTVPAALGTGKSLADATATWSERLVQDLQAGGWDVEQ